VKLTTNLNHVPRSRKVELYLHSPVCLHGVTESILHLNYKEALFNDVYETMAIYSENRMKHTLRRGTSEFLNIKSDGTVIPVTGRGDP
jgi:hypothetical protein